MRLLSATELIEVWERGFSQHPVDRALTLLSAWSGTNVETLSQLSIGRRDSLLLKMYEQLFGPSIAAFAECPQCAERMEYTLSTRDLLEESLTEEEGNELSLVDGDLSLLLRLPNSLDLQSASRCSDIAEGQKLLLKRCIVEARRGDRPITTSELPTSTLERVAERLTEADPLAEMLVNLSCTRCQHQWQVVLEIEKFLWVKINALAKRLLREVHLLAEAYGWRESDILALSATRRQIYLEMIRA